MILSLLYRFGPEECRFIMIDPKMLELSVYDRIPHLLAPVVTEPPKAIGALKWTVREMERRYRSMSQLGVRNIGGYNDKVVAARGRGEVLTRRVQTGFDPDTGKPVFEEQPLALEAAADDRRRHRRNGRPDDRRRQGDRGRGAAPRADGARGGHPCDHGDAAAVGGCHHRHHQGELPDAHLLPGDVEDRQPHHPRRTGRGTAARPGRHAAHAGRRRVARVHGPFVSDTEVERVVEFLREQGEPSYIEEVTEEPDEDGMQPGMLGGNTDGEASLYDQAVDLVTREGKASTSFVQRHLEHRLQPRRQADRADGEGGRGRRREPCRQARGAGAGAAGLVTRHPGEHGFHTLDPVGWSVLAWRDNVSTASDWTQASCRQPVRWGLVVASADNRVDEAIPFGKPPDDDGSYRIR